MARTFHEWLRTRRLAESRDGLEIQVANFLEGIVHGSVAAMKADLAAGRPVDLGRSAAAVWPAEAKSGGHLLLPGDLPPEVAGKPVQFRALNRPSYAEAFHGSQGFGGFVINTSPVSTARTPEEIDAYAERLKSVVHHEAEHVSHPGGKFRPEVQGDQRAAVDYMLLPGEVRAHARQMARAYGREFPGREFDLGQAQSILGRPDFNQTHANYFVKLAVPGEWEGVAAKHGFSGPNPHDEAVRLTKEFLPQYQ